MLKKIVIVFAAAILIFTGCSEASKVNHSISKQADYFESERRVTVYNHNPDAISVELKP